jgi:hypothetical protein
MSALYGTKMSALYGTKMSALYKKTELTILGKKNAAVAYNPRFTIDQVEAVYKDRQERKYPQKEYEKEYFRDLRILLARGEL